MAEERNVRIKIDSNAASVAQDTNALGASIENLTNANAQSSDQYKNLRTQMREANMELQRQIQLTGESSQETIAAARAVAGLRDQMEFANDLALQFNPDQRMRALGAATQVAGTGLQGVTAGMALFGSESEDTQKQLLKVQAAMAFSDAISNLSNLGDQWRLLQTSIQTSTIATKANTAATGLAAMVQKAFTGSVAVTTTGFKALKFAIAATGIGLLVVGVGLLVANFEKVKDVLFKVVPGLEKAGDFIMNIVKSITDFIGVTSEAGRLLDKQKEFAEKSIKQNERYLERNASTLSDARKREIELSNEHFKRLAEGRFSEEESKKIYQEARAKDEIDRISELNKKKEEIAQKAKEEADKKREKDREDAKKEREEYLKDANSFTENQAEIDAEIAKKKKEKEEKEYQDGLQKQLERAKTQKEIADQLALEQANRDKAGQELEEFLQNKKNEVLDKGIGFLNVVAGKNKAIQKAAIIAEGGISVARSIKNTVEGNAGALAKSILQLGPIAGPPAATPAIVLNTASGALSVATTVAQTAKALQSIGAGGSVSGGSAPSFSGASQATPQVAFNNTAENQIGRSIANAQIEQPPLKVVLLESDVTTAQNNVKVLVEKNTIG